MSIFFNPAKHPHRLKPQPLGELGERYTEDWPMSELDFLETVDKQQCILVNKDIRRRDAFAFPGFISGIIAFAMFFHFVFMDHHKSYTNFNKRLQTYTLEYKALYEDKTQRDKLPEFVVDKYTPYFNQEKISLVDYFHVYFNGYITTTPYLEIFLSSILLLILFLFIVVGGYQSFFKKPRTLVFDRDKNLVYTWHGGKVFVARYPEVGVGKIGKMIAIQLFGFDKYKQSLVTELFFPNVYVYSVYHTSTDYHDQRFINFINTYMREGRDALIQSNYYREKPKVFFGKNPIPAGFEQQIDAILVKLDKEKPHAQHS
ncbi:hypothetical protein [Providencia stuartii]|uniref:hypothetical protein n=1 Tax=Providencia stuartii TaxID=588 RepID=UPI001121D975|nr:hypothetical protein [Providencia stuartii]